jgi:alkylresorcinol/alkylpyrone synthase
MTAGPTITAMSRLEVSVRHALKRAPLELWGHPVDAAALSYRNELTKSLDVDVGVASVATAVPANEISQQEATERARHLFPRLASRDTLYGNTGIETRYACKPADWYHQARSWEERTEAFGRHAVDLLEEVARKTTASAGVSLGDIDALVVNTVTGVVVPSLDALLMNRLPFRDDVERLPIFGFGCGGGVAGLSRAAQFARARPGTNVLFLSVDLCSLCLRIQDDSLAMFVATALFGDGAAGAVLRHLPRTPHGGFPSGISIMATGDHFWRKTEHIMGWNIKEDGLGVVLSPELTQLLRHRFQSALDGFLAREGLTLNDFDGFLFHPGSRKVLECLGSVLNVTPTDLGHSWAVLRNYGNMSSATVLFVLERALASGAKGRHLLGAFGPGFSAYFAVLDL